MFWAPQDNLLLSGLHKRMQDIWTMLSIFDRCDTKKIGNSSLLQQLPLTKDWLEEKTSFIYLSFYTVVDLQ